MKIKKTRSEKEEKRYTRRLFLWAVIAGLVCAGLLVATLVYFFVPRDSDTYILDIPTFVGKAEGEIGRYSGIEIEKEWVYSTDVPKGRVISQTPYGGARRKLKSGDSYDVKIFISLGEKTERIPDLSGVGANSAAAALRGLHARVRSVAIYGDGEDGRVLYTSPRANSEIRAGDTVTMFISRQRVDKPVRVPDFCGLELAEAYRMALMSGLYIAESDTVLFDSIVQRQSIPAGSIVKRGSYISFISDEATEENEREWPPIAEEKD